MLPLHDGQLRLLVLNHLVSQLQEGSGSDWQVEGFAPEQLDCLRQLSMSDIKGLASMRHPQIRLVLDGASFATGLRNLALLKDMKCLQNYFIRHGASPVMMKSFFKIPESVAISHLRAQGHKVQRGRPQLPPRIIRDRIHRFWVAHEQLDIRTRYYRLHQTFPSFTLHALSGVVSELKKLE